MLLTTNNDFFLDDNYLDPEIEDLINLMTMDEQESTGFLTKKRVDAHFKECGEMLNLFIAYPDTFVDLITPKANHFNLFFFQRIMLRAMSRGYATYETFSRGTSKSFLADLNRYLTCMFIPRHKTSITAGTNKQAA